MQWAASRESKAAAGAPSKFCGAEVLVTNAHTGTTINAWVTEHCAYCVGECVPPPLHTHTLYLFVLESRSFPR